MSEVSSDAYTYLIADCGRTAPELPVACGGGYATLQFPGAVYQVRQQCVVIIEIIVGVVCVVIIVIIVGVQSIRCVSQCCSRAIYTTVHTITPPSVLQCCPALCVCVCCVCVCVVCVRVRVRVRACVCCALMEEFCCAQALVPARDSAAVAAADTKRGHPAGTRNSAAGAAGPGHPCSCYARHAARRRRGF